MKMLEGFAQTDKIKIINTVNNGLTLWNDPDQIEFGEIRKQNLIEIITRALTKRGYYITKEEIKWVISILKKVQK
jgi:hypothetical protein